MPGYKVYIGPRLNEYSTGFPAIENPLSQGGSIWVNGADSYGTVVQVSASAKCHGTQTSTPPPYDDSQAWLLQSYAERQEVELVVAKAGGLDSVNREVEILLWSGSVPEFTAIYGQSKTDCFEVNWQHAGSYLILGRFKMAEIDRIAVPSSPTNGDKFRMRTTSVYTGPTLTSVQFQVYINDVAQVWNTSGTTTATYTGQADHPTGSKFPNGRHPGVGFYRDGGASNADFYVTQFTAREF